VRQNCEVCARACSFSNWYIQVPSSEVLKSLSIRAAASDWPQGATLPDFAEGYEACRLIQNIFRTLTPKYFSSTPFPTLLRQHLPKQFVDDNIFGTYNTACTFIKHMKYVKAELVEVEDMLKKPTHKCDVCKTGAKLATTSAPPSSTEIGVEEAHEDVQSPQPPLPRTEADLHTLHKGHGFTKNMWI